MSKNCAGCCKVLTPAQCIQCSKCDSAYHYVCVNIADPRKQTDSLKKEWTCPACQSKQPKKGNSNTPVRPAAQVGDLATTTNPNTNVTLRAQNRKASSPLVSHEAITDPEGLTSLIKEIKLMRQDMGKMNEHLQILSSSFTQCNARIDEWENRFTTLASRIRVLEDREIENKALRQKVIQLEEQLNFQAQSQLSNEMEIVGVNECPNESRIHLVLTAALKIGMTLTEADLDSVTRAGPKRSGSTREGSTPRPLVVKFVRRSKRNEFLKAAKSRRGLTITAIDVDGPSRKLFFNERLTKSNRRLFREARVQSNHAGFKYCWTRNGTILVRKKNGSPEIIIRNEADIDQYLRSTPQDPSSDDQDPACSESESETQKQEEAVE